MKQHSFEKFINKESNAKKKEAIRQEKRRVKQEIKDRKYGIQNPKSEIRNQSSVISDQPLVFKRQASGFSKHVIGSKQSQNIETEISTHQHQTSNIKQKTTNYKLQTPKAKQQIINNKQQLQNIQRPTSSHEMPLNKFIAHAGICARREAAELVKQGNIKVNNNVVTEPGFKVSPNDKITVNNRLIHIQKNLVYVLLNKPKDYITTAKDPQGRKTIFDIVKGISGERIFPVGRLDRNTTGVLLLTNDGELTQKLTHPSFEVKKIYEAKLDKPLSKKDMDVIANGIELEDGFIKPDLIGYADDKDKTVIGIEIHSGRNRIVRRIFERLGYDVKSLDRVLFANLTKKNVERGKWRYLNEREIRLLKYMNQSFIKKKSTDLQPAKR